MGEESETRARLPASALARAQADAELQPIAAPAARALTTASSSEPASATPAAKQRPSRRLPLLLIACLVLAVAGYVGWQWWTDWRFVASTDDAYLHADVSMISPEIAGYIQSVPVADNQQVHAGDALATIDDRDYRANLAAAKAGLDAQK